LALEALEAEAEALFCQLVVVILFLPLQVITHLPVLLCLLAAVLVVELVMLELLVR
jgi:hypothetical protein